MRAWRWSNAEEQIKVAVAASIERMDPEHSIAYVREAPAEPLPPPITARGPIGWLRANFFATPFDTILTIVMGLLILWVFPPLIKFMLIDAVWTGADREACLETAARLEVGACWAFVGDRVAYFIYGSYPLSERWRVDIFFAMLAVGIVWLLKLDAPRRYLALGRAAGDHRGGMGRHRRVASHRHPAGARPPLKNAGRETVFCDLHRVRARRAADHRAVHGERDAAAVRARGLFARQAAARAGGDRDVRLRLYGRGRARRPAGDPEGAVRRRHGGRL